MIRFSIVVTVRNTSATLMECLRSLEGLNYQRERYEIIVVDDSSTNNTVATALGMGVTYLSETCVQNSYAARNMGIRAAKGEFIAFTNSDCIVDANWLREFDEASSDRSAGCLAGEILSVPPSTSVARFSERIGLLRQKDALSGSHFRPYARIANAAYRREVFDSIGVFDPTAHSGGDALLAWRMQDRTDFTIRYVPNAVVYHHHCTRVAELYSQFRRFGDGKISWALAHADYRPPTIATLEEDLSKLFGQHLEALEAADADDDTLISGLTAASQAAHLSGYLQGLLRCSKHGTESNNFADLARWEPRTCGLCGSQRFLPKPGAEPNQNEPPLCAECGSLERHRILSDAVKCMERRAAGALNYLFVGDDFRDAPTKLGFGDFVATTDLPELTTSKRKYDAAVIGGCLGRNKGKQFFDLLSATVNLLHEGSTLVIFDNIKTFHEDIALALPNTSVYDLRIRDKLTNMAVPVALLASKPTSLVRAFLTGDITLR